VTECEGNGCPDKEEFDEQALLETGLERRVDVELQKLDHTSDERNAHRGPGHATELTGDRLKLGTINACLAHRRDEGRRA
jgi:hypothetical protein